MFILFKKLDHVQLTIPSGKEEEARQFYGEILKLQEIEKPGPLKPSGGVWFKIAGIELHLGVENTVNTKRHPAFEIVNLTEARKYLEKNNIKIKEEIQIPGRKRFSFYDPFGNRIELLEYESS